MGFSGDGYSTASTVITSEGDLRIGNSSGAAERLAIGSSGKVLESDGSTASWETPSGSPTTTKGDLSGYSTSSARIPIGTNNYTILADSAQALGLKYAASATSILAASGDILYASSANTLAKLAKASDGDTLQLASGVPAWVTVAEAGGTSFFGFADPAFWGTSDSFWSVLAGWAPYPAWSYTESYHTTPVNTDLTFTRYQINVSANAKGSNQVTAFRDDGADVGAITVTASTTGTYDSGAVSVSIASGSSICWVYHGTTSGDVTFYGALGTVTT